MTKKDDQRTCPIDVIRNAKTSNLLDKLNKYLTNLPSIDARHLESLFSRIQKNFDNNIKLLHQGDQIRKINEFLEILNNNHDELQHFKILLSSVGDVTTLFRVLRYNGINGYGDALHHVYNEYLECKKPCKDLGLEFSDLIRKTFPKPTHLAKLAKNLTHLMGTEIETIDGKILISDFLKKKGVKLASFFKQNSALIDVERLTNLLKAFLQDVANNDHETTNITKLLENNQAFLTFNQFYNSYSQACNIWWEQNFKTITTSFEFPAYHKFNTQKNLKRKIGDIENESGKVYLNNNPEEENDRIIDRVLDYHYLADESYSALMIPLVFDPASLALRVIFDWRTKTTPTLFTQTGLYPVPNLSSKKIIFNLCNGEFTLSKDSYSEPLMNHHPIINSTSQLFDPYCFCAQGFKIFPTTKFGYFILLMNTGDLPIEFDEVNRTYKLKTVEEPLEDHENQNFVDLTGDNLSVMTGECDV